MVTRFGSREICNVTFKAASNHQKVGGHEFNAGQPVFVIDTATASSMEQATSTVYAQGGRGYNRLVAWEGEKTMTFRVTDALMSPMGLAVLAGAGLKKDADVKHIHCTYDVALAANDGTATIKYDALAEELGIPTSTMTEILVCNDTGLKPYATVLDSVGAIKGWLKAADEVTISGNPADASKGSNLISVTKDSGLKVTAESAKGETIKLDFYVVMSDGASEITIAPDDFGGYFYVEADTLYRNQNGKDMAATLTFPRVKIQSGFTMSMSATGDPSTFEFVMDAFPAYTYFDRAKQVVCDITIVSGDLSSEKDIQHATASDHGIKANG